MSDCCSGENEPERKLNKLGQGGSLMLNMKYNYIKKQFHQVNNCVKCHRIANTVLFIVMKDCTLHGRENFK